MNKKIILILLVVISSLILVSCGGNKGTYYEVKFDTGSEEHLIESQIVRNGGKVVRPNDPKIEGLIFGNEWLFGEKLWSFEKNIVKGDMTLTPLWLDITEDPSDLKTTEEAFSSTLTWVMETATEKEFVVSIKNDSLVNETIINGDLEIEAMGDYDVVTFVPKELPQGGTYTVYVDVDGTKFEFKDILFSGNGTSTNPYLVSDIVDLKAILSEENTTKKYYLQNNDIISTNTKGLEITNKLRVVFNGEYDGNNFSLSFSGNGGLFHEVSKDSVIKNLVIDGSTKIYAQKTNEYSIGMVANINKGLIENITAKGNVEDNKMSGELPVFSIDTLDTNNIKTGAGGIVGLNDQTGVINIVSVSGNGSVKAARGLGGVAAYNYGTISNATVSATLPAGNQANSGKSSNHYSYGGGIAGFNFGNILKSHVSGRVFAQSAYSEAGSGHEGKNSVFGGVAGFNSGLIEETSFARPMNSKEFINKTQSSVIGDAANNLGVGSIHGDSYIGGVVAINQGSIKNFYVGGAIIGGRDHIGGVSALNTGVIQNGYVFAEVAVKDEAGNKVLAPNSRTTLSTYELAPDNVLNDTVIYKSLLDSNNNTWNPNGADIPILPIFTNDDLLVVGDKFNEDGKFAYLATEIPIEEVIVTAGSFELPRANDNKDRLKVLIGVEFSLDIVINPVDATNKNYTITSTNSRARVIGNKVFFVKGDSNPGNVSIKINFEDPTIEMLEYRFFTMEEVK